MLNKTKKKKNEKWNMANFIEKRIVVKTTKSHQMSHLMTKPTKLPVRPAKTQISLDIRPVWSESSLSVWRHMGSSATHWAHSEDSDQIGRMPGWSEFSLGAQIILLVLSWGGSNKNTTRTTASSHGVWDSLNKTILITKQCLCITIQVIKVSG